LQISVVFIYGSLGICVVGSWYWQDHTQRRLLAL